VLQFATLEGARALGQEHRLGSVEPGKVADLLFIDTTTPGMLPVLDPVAAVVFHASISDIDTVLVHGKPVKRGGRLLADLGDVRRRVEESVSYLYWQKEAQLPPKATKPHPATRPLSCI
jgi:cytosine/adenosine deaminase-related metal-dependent hydrolase